jgi:ribosomal protein S18 acetylase RimI-like enzyme
MLVRQFQDSDEQAVIDLWREVFNSEEPHNDPAVTIRQKLAFERELFLVADVNGTVVGTAMGGYDGHRGWIYSVAVSPRYRRQGIASALIRRLEADLVKVGCLKVNLQVRIGNSQAISLYQELGFCVEDLISMGKRLYAE